MRLRLAHLAKLVLATAIACACIVPTTRLAQEGIADPRQMVAVNAMIVPLVGAVLAFPLVRRGPGRTLLVDALVLAAVTVPLGLLLWFVVPQFLGLLARGPATLIRPFHLPIVLGTLVALPPMAGLATWLAVRVGRGVVTLRDAGDRRPT